MTISPLNTSREPAGALRARHAPSDRLITKITSISMLGLGAIEITGGAIFTPWGFALNIINLSTRYYDGTTAGIMMVAGITSGLMGIVTTTIGICCTLLI